MISISAPADRIVQAVFLKGHIRLMNLGMTHSKLKKGDVIAKINTVLGTSFTNRQGVAAEQALKDFLEKHLPKEKPVNGTR